MPINDTIINMNKAVLVLGIFLLLSSCRTGANINTSSEDQTNINARIFNDVEQAFHDADFWIPEEARQALGFSLFRLNGGTATLSEYKGKAVILIFWIIQCPFCREEMPELEKLHRMFKDRGLEIFAINRNEDGDTIKEFMNENGYTFPVMLDSDGSVSSAYRVSGVPAVFILDKDGKIIATHAGTVLGNPNVIAAFEALLT